MNVAVVSSTESMKREFLVGSDFNDGPCRKLRLVKTPYGRVVAYENVVDRGPSYNPQFLSHTVVSGFYIGGEQLTERLRRMTVDTVPQEQRADVSKILREQGYGEPIAFR